MRRLLLALCLLLAPAWVSAQTISYGDNTGNTTGTDDGEIKQGSPTTNFGSSTTNEITEWTAGDFTYSPIKWTGYPTGIPGGATITAARIRFYLTGSNAGTHDITFYPLLVAMTEAQVTWNVRQTATNWTSGGAQGSGTDRSATAVCVMSSIGTTTGQYYNCNFDANGLAYLQNILDGTGGVVSHGFTQDRTAGADSQFRVFASSEGTDGQRPILEVTYTTGGGGSSIVIPSGLPLLGVGGA